MEYSCCTSCCIYAIASRKCDGQTHDCTTFLLQVVAPVRETCAQTLGVVLKYMSESGVLKTVKILLLLLTQEQWEVRHGGLLGIKYALAVRQVLADLVFVFFSVRRLTIV